MPTYDYRCGACSHTFEHFQSMSDPLLKKCPECGKKRLERLIGAGAGLLFKGSGFYITDYRSPSYQDAAKKDQGASPVTPPAKPESPKPDGAATPVKSDAKPASTPKDSSSKSSAPKKGSGGKSR